MAPVAKKDGCIILYDLRAQCRESSKQALLKILCRQYFSQSKNLAKLILFNSSVTGNRLEARHGGYEGIYETSEAVMGCNPRIMLDMVENIEPSDAPSNWLEALVVAAKCLAEDFNGITGIVTYQLLVLSDFTMEPPDRNDDDLQDIVNTLVSLGAYLYFVGPKIEAPFQIKDKDCIRTWMKDFEVDPGNKNLSLIKEIVSRTENSLVCDYRLGVHLFFVYKKFPGSQPWKVPLAMGTKIAIPADTRKLLNTDLKCKIVPDRGNQIITWVNAADESEKLDGATVNKGISRHGKFVRMPDNKMFSVSNPRGFNIVCFTSISNISEALMTGDGCYTVYPAVNAESLQAMTALISALAEKDLCAIARRVYNANNLPRLMVLIPKPDHKPPCFYLTTLPFLDDVKIDYNEKSVQSAPVQVKTPEVEKIYNYLDSLDIDEGTPIAKKFPLGVKCLLNPKVTSIVNKGVDKKFGKSLTLGDLDLDYLAPVELTPAGEDLKKIWPERELRAKDIEQKKSGDIESGHEFEW